MSEAEARSEVTREEAHGHVDRQPWLAKAIQRLLRPLALGQPDNGYSEEELKRPKDPSEDTAEEAMRELQLERMGGLHEQEIATTESTDRVDLGTAPMSRFRPDHERPKAVTDDDDARRRRLDEEARARNDADENILEGRA